MSVVLCPSFGIGYQGFTTGGLPLNAGKIYTYAAGGTTPVNTYTTSAGNVANANPIVLGADGRPPYEIWLTAGTAYRFDLKDSLDNLIKTYDNIIGINDESTLSASSGSSLVGFIQAGTGAVATTVQAKDRQTFSVFDFIPTAEQALITAGTPSIDVSAYIQAAHDAMPVLSLNKQGQLLFPPGVYTCTGTPLVFTPTIDVHGYGAVLDFSAASTSIVALTVVGTSVGGGAFGDTTVGDPIGGLRLNGPGSTSVGLRLGGGAAGNICHEKTLHDPHIEGFGSGLQQASNSYNVAVIGGFIQRNGINLDFPTGLTNTAEQYNFHGVTVAEATTNNIQIYSSDLDVNFFGGSVDYLNAAAGATSIEIAGDNILSFHGTHIEDSNNGSEHIFINNSTATGAPHVNCYGCTFTAAQGHASYPIINADHINLQIHGGWYRIAAGTQAIFVSSQDTAALDYQVMGGIGTVTSEVTIGTGTGPKFVQRAGLLTRGFTLPNAISAQAKVTGGTAYPIAYITASDKMRFGSSSVPMELDCHADVAGFYGFSIVADATGAMGFYVFLTNSAPTAAVAGFDTGCLVASINGKLYINTGNVASATWTVVGTQT